MIVLFSRGLAATAYMYVHVPTGFRARGRPELLHRGSAGAAGRVAGLYDGGFHESGTDLRADPDVFGTFAVARLSRSPAEAASNYGLIFAPLNPSTTAKRRATRPAILSRAFLPNSSGFPEPSWWRSSLRRFRVLVASADSSSSCRIWAATRCRSGCRGSQDRGRQPCPQGYVGLFTSFTANDPQRLVQIDREKAKAIGVPITQITPALGVYMGSAYVQRLRLQQSLVPRVRPGGSALPHERSRLCGNTTCARTRGDWCRWATSSR